MELSKELLETAGWEDINKVYSEGQGERNTQRLGILKEENQQLLEKGVVDKSLQGDIEKQGANLEGFGGFPRSTGLDPEIKSVDYKSVASTLSSDLPSDKDIEGTLSEMPHLKLQSLRSKYKTNEEINKYLAPFEHRAYAREAVAENPALAPIFAGILIPGYQAAKALGMDVSATEEKTTPASMGQVTQGLVGVGEGLAKYASKELLELLGVTVE
jgi:hypothetical protein